MSRAKRRAGEGSILRVRRGEREYWAVALMVAGRRVWRYAKTEREALAKLSVLRKARETGGLAISERLTVAAYLVEWLELASPQLRPRTARGYGAIVREHLVPGLGAKSLARLTPAEVQRFLNGLALYRAPRTVEHVRACLRAALQQAVRWGYLGRNVAALVDVPAGPKTTVHALTAQEAQRFLEVIDLDRLGALYCLGLTTGLRLGEALALRWADIDLDGGLLTVRASLARIDGAYRLVEPKTQRSRRTLALPGAALSRLREHRGRQLEERLRAPTWDWEELVFTTQRGRPLHGSVVTHRLQRILVAAGLPRQRFHDLRHGCASLLLAQGFSPRDVMETLGHSQIAVTTDLYGHMYEGRRREIAAGMDAALART